MRIAIDRRKGKAASISLKPIIVTEYASATVFTYATFLSRFSKWERYLEILQ